MPTRNFYEISEYQTLKEIQLSSASVWILENEYNQIVKVRPSRKYGYWDLTSNSYIGRIELPDAAIQIKPKVPVPRILDWIALAYDLKSLNVNSINSGYESDVGNQEWLVKFFIIECQTILTKGLKKGYIGQQEPLQSVRGQLQTTATLTRWLKNDFRFDCHYDELTTWVKENQIIYAGLLMMNQLNYFDPFILKELKKLLNFFGNDNIKGHFQLNNVHTLLEELNQLPINRLNQHYQTSFQLLSLYVKGLSFSNSLGENKLSSFLLDMNELFELYISKRLELTLQSYKIRVYRQKHDWLAECGKIKIIYDMILKDQYNNEIIIDTKYKQKIDDKAINSHIFQMVSYMTARNAKAAILLYAAGPEREDKIKQINKTVYQWSLKLDNDAVDFEMELDTIVESVLSLFHRMEIN
jgi:5-methylcytosine-specific restriction enzyme subunit McrC